MEYYYQPDERGVGHDSSINENTETATHEQKELPDFGELQYLRSVIERSDKSQLVCLSVGFSGEGSEARVPQPFEIDINDDGFMVGRLLFAYNDETNERLIYAEELGPRTVENRVVRNAMVADLGSSLIRFRYVAPDDDRIGVRIPSWVFGKNVLDEKDSQQMSEKQKDILVQLWESQISTSS